MSKYEGFVEKGGASVLIDGQWGSTGKGLAAAAIAVDNAGKIRVATTNASSNAGHTTVKENKKFVCFHLPTSGVMDAKAIIYLNAGSIIDPKVLMDEMKTLGVDKERVVVHPRAAVITQECKEEEADINSSATKLASTQKGVGAALSRKVKRMPGATVGENERMRDEFGGRIRTMNLNTMMAAGASVMVEIPQGFGLGLNSGTAYPYCTSREVSVQQGLSDAGIHPKFLLNTLMVLRTYPIRVGNIMNDKEMVGFSGPHYPDHKEIRWEEIGVSPEMTTVTGRVRRVFTFSLRQYLDAYYHNYPTHVFLNFVNYLKSREEFLSLLGLIQSIRVLPISYGLGPQVKDIEHDTAAVVRKMGW